MKLPHLQRHPVDTVPWPPSPPPSSSRPVGRGPPVPGDRGTDRVGLEAALLEDAEGGVEDGDEEQDDAAGHYADGLPRAELGIVVLEKQCTLDAYRR